MKPRFLCVPSGAVALAIASFTRSGLAAGIALDVQSARGTGMAGAMTAVANDSAAVYYNAAGIAQGEVLDAQVGITPIVPSYKYTGAGSKASTPFNVVAPFNAYFTAGLTPRLSVGFGVFNPFGLTLQWPSGWVGQNLITTASLDTYYVNPVVAVRVGPVRVGGGPQLGRATVELKREVRYGDAQGEADLGAGAWGGGGNVGVEVEAVEKYLSLGAQYRSAVKFDFSHGVAHFANVPPSFQGTIHDQEVTTSLVVPESIALGAATHPIRDLVIDVDVVWFGWSRFRSLDLRFPNDTSRSLSTSEPKNWHDTANVRVGAEETLSPQWRVRAGVLYDPSPSPSSTLAPDVPDADRINLAVGGTYSHESGFHIDLGYQFLVLLSKTSTDPTLPGQYGGTVSILGLSLGYEAPLRSTIVAPQ